MRTEAGWTLGGRQGWAPGCTKGVEGEGSLGTGRVLKEIQVHVSR